MKNVKFKLNLKEFENGIIKKVGHLDYDAENEYLAKIEYLADNLDIQRCFENTEKLISFIDEFTGINVKYKISRNRWLNLPTLKAELFETSIRILAKANFFDIGTISNTPLYPLETYDFFEFSHEQKNRNVSRINFFKDNEKNIDEIYKLSLLILILKNYDEIAEYLISSKKIERISKRQKAIKREKNYKNQLNNCKNNQQLHDVMDDILSTDDKMSYYERKELLDYYLKLGKIDRTKLSKMVIVELDLFIDALSKANDYDLRIACAAGLEHIIECDIDDSDDNDERDCLYDLKLLMLGKK